MACFMSIHVVLKWSCNVCNLCILFCRNKMVFYISVICMQSLYIFFRKMCFYIGQINPSIPFVKFEIRATSSFNTVQFIAWM